MTRFIVVPQWQGSPSTRAMLLHEGAEIIAGDLPRGATARIDVPLEAGESLGTGVHRLSALDRIRQLVTAELAAADDPAIVVGGDCGIAVPAIAHAATRHERIAVVWLDAHGDLNAPDTSPSGAFAGMALRAVLGDGELAIGDGAIAQERVVLAGARELDDAERDFLASSALVHVPADAFADADVLADAVGATDADAVYIHVDLDVLDPASMTGLTLPVPFGVEPSRLVAAISRLREALPLAGASVSGFAPSSPAAAVDDLGTILRVIGALA